MRGTGRASNGLRPAAPQLGVRFTLEAHVVRHVGVHEHDEVAFDERERVHVRRPETELAGPLEHSDLAREDLLQAQGHGHGSVRRAVLHNEDLVRDAAAQQHSNNFDSAAQALVGALDGTSSPDHERGTSSHPPCQRREGGTRVATGVSRARGRLPRWPCL